MRALALLGSGVLALAWASPAGAQVVPDGSTATTVGTGANGRPVVLIAPPNASSISHNGYSSFSVSASGVDLDNRAAAARTIVNEVTSARRSMIEGPVAVLGPRAHVVIANPNGITLDGAAFVNTGGVALSGGPVRYEASAAAPGTVNAVVSSGSDILVGRGGLAGTMASLQMIAGRLRVDGPVADANAGSRAVVELAAGHTEVVLDSAVPPGTTLVPWASYRDLGGATPDTLVDITPEGSLSASRVHIAVGARGAGVSFAGRGTASIGEFSIDSKGRVEQAGGRIRAEGAVKIRAASIAVLNAPDDQAQIASQSGAVTLVAEAGDIDIRGQITGASRDAGDVASLGAVTLAASGAIGLLSESSSRLAVVFASGGDLSVTAGGAVHNDTGRLLSNGLTSIVAGGALENVSAPVGGIDAGAPRETHRSGRHLYFGLFGPHRHSSTSRLAYGALRLPGQLPTIAGESVLIRSASLDNEGEILGLEGSVEIDTGTLALKGVTTGSATTTRTCGFICSVAGSSDVAVQGGRIGATANIFIRATGTLLNAGGQVTAYGNMDISAPEIRASALSAPSVIMQPAGLAQLFAGSRSRTIDDRVGGQFLAPAGAITLATTVPVELDGGEMAAAFGITNPAGTRIIERPGPRAGAWDHIGVFRGLLD